LILGLILIFGVAACAPVSTPTPTPQPIEQAIVGKWVNDKGGEIQFYADSTGLIPGVTDANPPIPDSKFTYYFQDEAHLGIVLEGQSAMVVGIKIEDDKMTWLNRFNSIQFTYTKAK